MILLQPTTAESWYCTFGSFVFFTSTHHRRTAVVELSFQEHSIISSTYHHRFRLPPLREGRRTVALPYFRLGSSLPGFPSPACLLHTCYNISAIVAAYNICFIFPALVAVYKAFLLDLCVLDIPFFSASSLSYALSIASAPAAHFRTRAFFSVLVWYTRYKAYLLDRYFLGLPVFGRMILMRFSLRY